ncbi:coiled-coil domain-containing protein 14 [Xyrichtys novacula]|uniref:Coiled-coil domain-containing protein 14 n=1 Tax=Xyrichtys novacula TaxID=13765 RepID=A0AAV1HMT5_XYRNO|nr:coiled-coil domain-containing protein 14 [Xyrichtys novacula]
MKGTAKTKVVTSGRLTGRVKVQSAKRRVPPNPAPPARPVPAYSLYSTDSEDQVTSLHKGLDRCADLLNGILQVDKSDVSPGVSRTLKAAAAKPKPSTSQGKKTMKKVPPQTDQKTHHSVQQVAGCRTPKTPHQTVTAPAAHSGVKLHPPRRHPQHKTPTIPPSQTITPSSDLHSHPPAPGAPPTRSEAQQEGDGGEFVPVRDVDPQTSDTHTCSLTMQQDLDPDQAGEDLLLDSHSDQTEERQRNAQDLLEELRALIAGQGIVAERLLGHLELTLCSSSSSLIKTGGSDIQAEAERASLQSQNTQLHRRVRNLQQQLKQIEEAERRQDAETFSASEVLILQGELTAAQSQLQELQFDLTELRKALQDTQSGLRESEAERAVIQTDLETTRRRLEECEREKSEFATLAQKRQEEIHNLNRILQSRNPSVCPAAHADSQISQQHFHRNPAEPPLDRITQYLKSLGQMEKACVSTETDAELPSHPAVRSTDPSVCSSLQQPENHRRQLFNSSLSHCDRVSLCSDWSRTSGSTFNTRDEAAFRDGLAALDATIASLQKTMKLDLKS